MSFRKKMRETLQEDMRITATTGTRRVNNEKGKHMIVNLENKWEAREEEMVKKITVKAVENIVEIQDKEKQQKNTVLFSVPERRRKSPRTRTMIQKVKDAKLEKMFEYEKK